MIFNYPEEGTATSCHLSSVIGSLPSSEKMEGKVIMPGSIVKHWGLIACRWFLFYCLSHLLEPYKLVDTQLLKPSRNTSTNHVRKIKNHSNAHLQGSKIVLGDYKFVGCIILKIISTYRRSKNKSPSQPLGWKHEVFLKCTYIARCKHFIKLNTQTWKVIFSIYEWSLCFQRLLHE